MQEQFEDTVDEIIELVEPLFADIENIRLHGDCHPANIIYRPGESIYLIDFDDMAVGPAVQDLWMLLPGHARHAQRELNLLLEGYEMFRSFDRRSLRLIEPLRAMRSFTTRRGARTKKRTAVSPGFRRTGVPPHFGSRKSTTWKNRNRKLRML